MREEDRIKVERLRLIAESQGWRLVETKVDGEKITVCFTYIKIKEKEE
ncbi:MAG: hypothetical protein OCU22_09245 [Canidatus Methanoxibalbensis ujae]|nr:hypothetical protein [Candidatus Methanoxibalbensis ujae]